jgi:hypothetical protein
MFIYIYSVKSFDFYIYISYIYIHILLGGVNKTVTWFGIFFMLSVGLTLRKRDMSQLEETSVKTGAFTLQCSAVGIVQIMGRSVACVSPTARS